MTRCPYRFQLLRRTNQWIAQSINDTGQASPDYHLLGSNKTTAWRRFKRIVRGEPLPIPFDVRQYQKDYHDVIRNTIWPNHLECEKQTCCLLGLRTYARNKRQQYREAREMRRWKMADEE